MACAGQTPLSAHDPELFALIQKEKERQKCSLELIASENFTSRAVNECLGSCLTNKYSEGQPGARYYGGNEYIDMIEQLCRKRALQAFGLDPVKWGVNVQPYSGSPANFAVFTALLRPNDRIMGLDLPSGGHLTHGYYSANAKDGKSKAISATSVYFQSLPYPVNPVSGLLDYDELQHRVDIFKPNLIICGGSAYPRDWDYARFRAIADTCGALLMCDMAHISGLVATGEAASPFEHCDVVTTTTHKSLRGPRAGMIFCKKEYEEKINFAVFPMIQGGPHEHQIAGIAAQLLEVMTPEFKAYSKQVRANARALGEALIAAGHKLATGGTDNHLVLWDLRPHAFTGSKMEKLCEAVSISLNKNAIAGDRNAIAPGAVRVGMPALTTRGFNEDHFRQVATFLDRTLRLGLKLQASAGKALVDFVKAMDCAEVHALREEIETFAKGFPMPGLDF